MLRRGFSRPTQPTAIRRPDIAKYFFTSGLARILEWGGAHRRVQIFRRQNLEEKCSRIKLHRIRLLPFIVYILVLPGSHHHSKLLDGFVQIPRPVPDHIVGPCPPWLR